MYQQPYMANQNLAAMNMGMGMPMMGMGASGAIMNGVFMYSGNPVGLLSRLQSLTPAEASTIRQVTIRCVGNQIKQTDVCCYICTIVGGSILIFPICFMCCGWWQRMVFSAFEVPQSVYQSLQYIFSFPNVQSVTLNFIDNRLDAKKCQILYNMMSRSSTLKGFTFMNGAQMYDFYDDEWSKFEDNMRPIKKLPIFSEIKWGSKLVL